MNRGIPCLIALMIWGAQGGAALINLPELPAFVPIAVLAASASPDAVSTLPGNIRNNQYFLESKRLTALAQDSFEYGDYDASTQYASEALRYAQLSDEYIALQLKIRETENAITAAWNRFTWARSVGAAARYPAEFGRAENFYNAALSFRNDEEWDEAIEAARQVINALANVTDVPPKEAAPPPPKIAAPPPPPPPPAAPPPKAPVPDITALPSQYTVRPWAVSKDCLWNIAGRPWAYGDPTKWRLLYDANRTKLPEPNNPDLIRPGMVLDIPSIRGETRQGMWDAARSYTPLR
ncbi:MAG: LysM peptidoglycan-binding domain-containing protein [Spirochaetaceae bacterium]|nr:LysM peptidoglycan-binding domain-containing protein [Spirochaetaceae bacterium]